MWEIDWDDWSLSQKNANTSKNAILTGRPMINPLEFRVPSIMYVYIYIFIYLHIFNYIHDMT